jgi:ribonucleoside-diphosphate reductase alpha chain
MDYLKWLSSYQLDDELYAELHEAIHNQEIAPSMRLINMGGEVAKKLPESIFNCSYLPISDMDAFTELMWLSMAGTGVGYSVERRYVDKLPKVSLVENPIVFPFRIEDSAEGWVDALKFGLSIWITGNTVDFDYSLIRPHGTPLKTKGGTASGHKVFQETLEEIEKILRKVANYNNGKIRGIDAHDICCWLANAVVQGNVRRSALISLFDADDQEMLSCKSPSAFTNEKGVPFSKNMQRFRANNSLVLEHEISYSQMEKLFMQMHNSGTSEPGIFSRYAVQKTTPERRDKNFTFGTNPCAEISLRPYETCNLSSAIIRSDDERFDVIRKVRLAAILGTIQSIATDGFSKKYLREEWRINGREERLLGVDLNGIQDNFYVMNSASFLEELKQTAIETNREIANKLKINPSVAITTIKPSGNSSSLYNTSAGIHPRYAPYYIRRVRLSAKTLMHEVFSQSRYPLVADTDQKHKPIEEVTTWVAEFPAKSPENAVHFSKDFTGMNFLNFWLLMKKNYTEHNPSVTISYTAEEVDDIIDFMFTNQEYISGLSFSQLDNTGYELPPYEEIDEQTYLAMVKSLPAIDWSLVAIEKQDSTTVSEGAIACGGGLCLI